MAKDYEYENEGLYYVDCDKEEREKFEYEQAEKRKFVEGMKKYPEMGVAVYIDGKIPEEQDWEKLIAVREDGQFYMADYIMEELPPEQINKPPKQVLTSIHWNIRYHDEQEVERQKRSKRNRRRRTGE